MPPVFYSKGSLWLERNCESCFMHLVQPIKPYSDAVNIDPSLILFCISLVAPWCLITFLNTRQRSQSNIAKLIKFLSHEIHIWGLRERLNGGKQPLESHLFCHGLEIQWITHGSLIDKWPMVRKLVQLSSFNMCEAFFGAAGEGILLICWINSALHCSSYLSCYTGHVIHHLWG